jgi:hypothetical protein
MKMDILRGIKESAAQYNGVVDETIEEGQGLIEAAKKQIWKKFVDQIFAQVCKESGNLYEI